jgi:hypothetical protein
MVKKDTLNKFTDSDSKVSSYNRWQTEAWQINTSFQVQLQCPLLVFSYVDVNCWLE